VKRWFVDELAVMEGAVKKTSSRARPQRCGACEPIAQGLQLFGMQRSGRQ